jgi:hypothetical protein
LFCLKELLLWRPAGRVQQKVIARVFTLKPQPNTPGGFFMAAAYAFQKHGDRVYVAPEGFSEKALGSPLLGVIGTYFVLQ